MDTGLSGKNAVVTGGGSGIGKQIVLALAREGVNVVICDISKDMADETAREIEAMGVKAMPVVSDVSKVEEHKDFVAKVESEFGQIDILVNNAGVSFKDSILEMTPEKWDLIFGINLRGGFFLSQAVFEKMLERKEGRIINIASVSGLRPADFSDIAYCSSKAGVVMMTKVFAKHVAGTRITCNSVCPGLIETPLSIRIGSKVDPDKVPANRMGQPSEVADAVVFLASAQAAYINGQSVSVNGGQYML